MRSIFIFLCLALNALLAFGQSESMFRKGQFQLAIRTGFMPVNKTNSSVDFSYVDGDQNAAYLPDTVSVSYRLDRRNFGHTLSIGVGYFVTEKLRTSISVKPHLNSFLANEAKNGKVYGVHFDLGLDYFATIANDFNVLFGATASRIIGGFGIASGGPKSKDYLVVNGNELYDNDIGFHIIDNSWAFSPKLGLHYKVSNAIAISANSGFLMTFGRTSRMNFAGLLQDETLKWNSKGYDDSDVNLTIDNTKISNDNIDSLPFDFSGFFLELGMTINLNK
jgi:hypothetical protein